MSGSFSHSFRLLALVCALPLLASPREFDLIIRHAHVVESLAARPYGMVLLAVVAAGLGAYGVSCFSEARFRATRA